MSVASEITRINTNVANAYTACAEKGAAMPQTQNSANLADTIATIKQGPPERKEINIYDYDGTLLYGFTCAEFSALLQGGGLSGLTFPVHEGLVFSGLNWTLPEIVPYAQEYGCCDVGAVYSTDDGATRLHITHNTPAQEDMMIVAECYTAEIDWDNGNGFEDFYDTEGIYRYEASDTYPVDRVIRLRSEDPYDILCLAIYVDDKMIDMGNECPSMLRKVELGCNASLDRDIFNQNDFYLLDTLLFSQGSLVDGIPAICGCPRLSTLTIPYGVTGFMDYYGISANNSLKRVLLPNSLTEIRDISQNDLIETIMIPNSVIKICDGAFERNSGLKTLVIPNSVREIGTGIFDYCDNLTTLDMSHFTDPNAIPTLAGPLNRYYRGQLWENFYPIYYMFKILVANESMQQAFSSATNWSGWAHYFEVKEAE